MQNNISNTCHHKVLGNIKALLLIIVLPVYVGSVVLLWYVTLHKAPTLEAKGVIICIFMHFICAIFLIHRIKRELSFLFLIISILAYSALIIYFIQVLMGVIET